VQWAIDEGVVWVTAAGNYARRHWGSGLPVDREDDRWIDIAPNVRIDGFTVAPGADFDLHASWLGDADLDLCLFEPPADEPIACADGVQDSGDRMVEVLRWRNPDPVPRRFGFGVRLQRGVADRVDVFGKNISDLQYGAASGSVLVPGDVADAITVGAVPWWDPSSLTTASGRGPTADGRSKPDLVAPSGITTSLGVFGGTSAATPHVAGIAALLFDAYPATPSQAMADLLRSRAEPLGASNMFGAGLADPGPLTPACRGLAPTIVGTRSGDVITGTAGPDVISGRGGADVIDGRGGDDVICGGPGADILTGGSGSDRLNGGAGSDTVSGGVGNDAVLGGPGDDLLIGGPGDDRVSAGPGDDRCPEEHGIGCESG
jgi:Ca2+-binding RTX toxin-like protein